MEEIIFANKGISYPPMKEIIFVDEDIPSPSTKEIIFADENKSIPLKDSYFNLSDYGCCLATISANQEESYNPSTIKLPPRRLKKRDWSYSREITT